MVKVVGGSGERKEWEDMTRTTADNGVVNSATGLEPIVAPLSRIAKQSRDRALRGSVTGRKWGQAPLARRIGERPTLCRRASITQALWLLRRLPL
jgi:hypothetical protein